MSLAPHSSLGASEAAAAGPAVLSLALMGLGLGRMQQWTGRMQQWTSYRYRYPITTRVLIEMFYA